MKPHWDDLKTALALQQHVTLSGAAKALDVTYTTVARRITRLEEALGTTLFERFADGYRPTEAAALVARYAAEMEQAQDAMLRQMAGQDSALSGVLTLTAPQLVIAHVIAPALGAFRAAHPGIELEVRATNDLLDLSRREADVAVRISRSPGDTLKGLRLAEQHSASFANRDWAWRIEDDPKQALDWVVYSGLPNLPKAVQAAYPGSRVAYRFDDMVAISGAVQAGLGIARMPLFLGRKLPGLVQVPCIAPQPYADVWLVAHPDVWSGGRVQAFRDVIVPFVKQRRADFVA